MAYGSLKGALGGELAGVDLIDDRVPRPGRVSELYIGLGLVGIGGGHTAPLAQNGCALNESGLIVFGLDGFVTGLKGRLAKLCQKRAAPRYGTSYNFNCV
jgi:hypothetical protein